MYTTDLITPFEKSASRSWNEHPRPQLKRDAWLSLCGDWSLSVMNEGKEQPLGTIHVPYPPESRLSGIGRQLSPGEKWLYRRSFLLPAHPYTGHTLLHFGAADQIARIWVNGKLAGEHTGGYLPFSSYYIVVVFIDPLQGLYAILFGDTVVWLTSPTT